MQDEQGQYCKERQKIWKLTVCRKQEGRHWDADTFEMLSAKCVQGKKW